MKFLHILAIVWIFGLNLLVPAVAPACPLCGEAIANANANSNPDDVDNFPAAMNQSIYLMLAVPYTALGIVGFCIYRGVKANEAHRQEAHRQAQESMSETQV